MVTNGLKIIKGEKYMTREELLERFSDKILTEEEIQAALQPDEFCELDIKVKLNSMTYLPYIEFSGKITTSPHGNPDYFELVKLLIKLKGTENGYE